MKCLLLRLCTAAATVLPVAGQTCTPDLDLELTAAPTLATPGQLVSVTLANASPSCTYTLLTTCVFETVKPKACDADPVKGFACGDALTPIAPGASVVMAWDQTSDLGMQVPDGLYRFPVTVVTDDGQKLERCAFVQVGTSCTTPIQYGFASAGAGGLRPALSSLWGVAQLGSASFALAVSNAAGGAPAACFASLGQAQLSLGFGTLLVDPASVFFSAVALLSGAPGAAGQGLGSFPLAIPSAPGLVGLEAFAQVFVADGAALGGLAHTAGLRIAVCP